MNNRLLSTVLLSATLVSGAALASAPASQPMTHTSAPAATHTAKPQIMPYHEATIGTLPATGEVRVKGEVASALEGKIFTLKDSTGSIKVELPKSEVLSLKEGAEVTVYGKVEGEGDKRMIMSSRVVEALAKPVTPKPAETQTR